MVKYIIKCKIKDLRKEHDLTQEELANKLGISRQALIALEQGKSLPSLNLALDMASVFEKTIEEMFCDIEKEINKQLISPIIGRKEKKMSRELMPFRAFGPKGFFDDELFSEDFLPSRNIKFSTMVPSVDVYNKGNDIVVEAHIPGMKEEDIQIDVSDEYITLSGERKQEKEDKEKNYYQKEVSYGSFKRVIAMPVKVISEKAEAEVENGILKIKLPKAQIKKAKRIKINSKRK